MVLEERDGGWMIVKTANDRVDDSIERWDQVCKQLRLGDDGEVYIGWFTIYNSKGIDILLRKCWVHKNFQTHSINHDMNEICIS